MVPTPPQEIRRCLYKWGAAQRSLQVRVGRQGLLLSPPHPTPPRPNPPIRRFDTTEHPTSVMCPHVRVRRQVLLLSPPRPAPPQPTKQLWVGVLMCVRTWSWSVCADDADLCAEMIRGSVRRWSLYPSVGRIQVFRIHFFQCLLKVITSSDIFSTILVLWSLPNLHTVLRWSISILR